MPNHCHQFSPYSDRNILKNIKYNSQSSHEHMGMLLVLVWAFYQNVSHVNLKYLVVSNESKSLNCCKWSLTIYQMIRRIMIVLPIDLTWHIACLYFYFVFVCACACFPGSWHPLKKHHVWTRSWKPIMKHVLQGSHLVRPTRRRLWYVTLCFLCVFECVWHTDLVAQVNLIL